MSSCNLSREYKKDKTIKTLIINRYLRTKNYPLVHSNTLLVHGEVRKKSFHLTISFSQAVEVDFQEKNIDSLSRRSLIYEG